MLTVFIFIIVLAVLIFVHELGHFITARAAGIRVDAFKIGFGPRIIHWKRGETEYGINLIPFGGYVKIHGENPDEESVSGPDSARSLVNKPRWKQVMVLVAGVTFNFLFAWLLYIAIFNIGAIVPPTDFEQYSNYYSDPRIIIVSVSDDSPAKKAGLMIGDVINLADTQASVGSTGKLSIDGIQNFIAESNGETLKFNIERNHLPQIIEVTPIKGLVENKYAIGIIMSDVVTLKLPFLSSIKESIHYTYYVAKETVIGLALFVGSIFQGSARLADVSGPVGIAIYVGDALRLGLSSLLLITALISINLGIINLIPFPALDGGRVLFVLIEGVIRRRISMKFTNIVNTVGFVLLMLLMIVVTYKDIVRLVK